LTLDDSIYQSGQLDGPTS